MKEKVENAVIITRKYHLIPTSSDRKEWNKRVKKFIERDSRKKD